MVAGRKRSGKCHDTLRSWSRVSLYAHHHPLPNLPTGCHVDRTFIRFWKNLAGVPVLRSQLRALFPRNPDLSTPKINGCHLRDEILGCGTVHWRRRNFQVG